MIVALERFAYLNEGTLGRVRWGNRWCYTLEQAWRDNGQNISCIPEGRYRLLPDREGRYTGFPELQDVPGRSEIIIHSANWPTQLQGCLAPGQQYVLGGPHAITITDSVLMLHDLRRALDFKDDWIEITHAEARLRVQDAVA